MTNKQWWQHNFNADYLKTYVDIITPATTKKQLSFITKKVPLKKSAKILDLACGHGRISFALDGLGYDVTGLDYSAHFIEIAKAEANKRKAETKFLRGDMRHLPFAGQFDAVINIYTSFGYFESEKENVDVLGSVNKALKPRGFLLMDLNNTLRTITNFAKKGKIDKESGLLVAKEKEKLSNGVVVKTTYKFDAKKMRSYVVDEWKENGTTHQRNTSIRGYTFPEVRGFMEENGFVIKNVWGDFSGSEYRFDSPRIIILAQKK